MALLILSAVSGTGKSTVVAELLKHYPNLRLSVSHTTRAMRPGEIDGVHYHFVDRAKFEALRDAGGFAEWTEYAGNLYGTAYATIEAAEAAGLDLLFEVEVEGARNLATKFPAALTFFLLPPSIQALADRLRGRGTEAEEVIARRLAIGQSEFLKAPEFQYLVVNHTVSQAVSEIGAIYSAFSDRRRSLLAHLKRLQAEQA